MIKNINRYSAVALILGLAMLFPSCTEELSIADFEDDFGSYEQELRIEGILDGSDFSKSIIRVDKTVLVTDTSLFNGIDDNGDWESYTDVNGNGQWDEGEPLNDDIGYGFQGPNSIPEGRGNGIPDAGEPHVDDYIEILPQLHDSTLVSIVLLETETGTEIAEFEWKTQAAFFDEIYGAGGPPTEMINNPYTHYSYGAYVPGIQYADLELIPGASYTLEMETAEGQTISATTQAVAAPLNLGWSYANQHIIWDRDTLLLQGQDTLAYWDQNAFVVGTPGISTTLDTIAYWDQDTLVYATTSIPSFQWNTPTNVFYGMVGLDPLLEDGTTRNFITQFAATIFTDEQSGLPIFQGNLLGLPGGVYKVEIASYNDDYGDYVFSGLPLRDREISNWRDEDDNVVLGALGSKTGLSLYLRMK